jgi:UDP-N-acetylmuramoylalanine--D-glutamate ligase
MTRWEDKKITIFGLGKSGAALARRLAPLKASILITDNSKEAKIDPKLISEMKALGVKLELGGHTQKAIENVELIIMSPGVHLDLPILLEAKNRRIPIISEIEVASRFISKPIIAVTGTNGKTTTCTLINEFLNAAGKRSVLAGNIGNPLIEVDDKDLDFIVVEISSYQLESVITFRPWISLLLNISEDIYEPKAQ